MNEQSKPSRCSNVHPRVIELMRERIGRKNVGEKMTDEGMVKSTEYTLLRISCSSQHASECIVEAFAAVGRSIRSQLKDR